MGWKVWVLGVTETNHATNGLVFPSKEAAENWGERLLDRWSGAKSYEVRETDEDVNTDKQGHLTHL